MRQPLTFERIGHSPSQPTVVFLPGAMTTGAEWSPALIRGIADQGFNLLLMDHRNSGRNPWYPNSLVYSLEDMAHDVSYTLMCHRVRKCHLVGASMGGAIAQLLSIKESETVQSMSLLMSTSERGIWSQSIPMPCNACMRGFARAARETNPKESLLIRYKTLANGECVPDSEYNLLVERDLRRGYNPDCGHLLAFEHSKSRTGRLTKVRCPTLIAHGDRDPLPPLGHAHILHENIDDAEILILKGVGHHISEKTGLGLVDPICNHIRVSDFTRNR